MSLVLATRNQVNAAIVFFHTVFHFQWLLALKYKNIRIIFTLLLEIYNET